MTQFSVNLWMKNKTWFNRQVYSSLVMLFISIDIESLLDNQKVNRDTVLTQKNLCVLRKFLCRHRKYSRCVSHSKVVGKHCHAVFLLCPHDNSRVSI